VKSVKFLIEAVEEIEGELAEDERKTDDDKNCFPKVFEVGGLEEFHDLIVRLLHCFIVILLTI